MAGPADKPTLRQRATDGFARIANPEPPPDEKLFVVSYLGLRKAIGVLGLALPVVLLFGRPLFEDGAMPGSISGFYYTSMRNYFVGTLCALAVFLFSYKYAPRDNILSSLAGLFALGVVFFPTTAAGQDSTWIGKLHLVSAALFFLVLAAMAFFIFTRSPLAKDPMRPRRLLRNKIYRACGITIVTCLVLAALLSNGAIPDRLNALFWLESIMVWAFSWSWLIKGGFLLKD